MKITRLFIVFVVAAWLITGFSASSSISDRRRSPFGSQ